MKKIFLATLAMSVAFTLTGCKGANEKRGDEHLANERYRNAIAQYVDALKKGKISDESPIGMALMEKSVGDVVEVETPGGVVELKVLEISK